MGEGYRKLVKSLNQVNVLHRIYIHRAVGGHGLYFGQMPILEYVGSHERCTQREVADELQVSPPSVATSVKRLQKTGMLLKTGDERDLRRSRLTLTALGRETAARCRADFDAVDARMFAGFTGEECETLYVLLGRMAENLADEELRGKSMFSLLAKEKELDEKGGGRDA